MPSCQGRVFKANLVLGTFSPPLLSWLLEVPNVVFKVSKCNINVVVCIVGEVSQRAKKVVSDCLGLVDFCYWASEYSS